MIDFKRLDEIGRRVSDLLPPGAERLHSDLREQLRIVTGAALERMDLVTREEFDVQAAVLARTRERLAALERTVAELEARLETSAPGARGPRSAADPDR